MKLFRRRFTAPGAPPGSVTHDGATVPPRIGVMVFDAGHLDERSCESRSEVPEATADRVTWVDVQGLGDGSIVQQLGEEFGLHAMAVADVINVGQRPKVEPYEHHLFVVLRMVTLDDDGRLQWEQVALLLGDDWVLTFQESHGDCLEPLRSRIRAGRRAIRSGGADYLAAMVIDAIVDGYFPVLEAIGDHFEQLEERVLADRGEDILQELYLTKRDLAGFRRATWPLREALGRQIRTEEYALSDAARLHLRDALDHTMQVVEVNESYRELAASLVDVHLSMVGQRTNEVMRVLTVVSAIFIPLTFLAGIYGMNFDTSRPLNLPELSWRYGYLFFWAACLALATTLLVLFRRLGWLGGHRRDRGAS